MQPTKGKTMHQMRLLRFQRQDGLCWLCSEPLDLFQPQHSLGSASWEHVIPRSSGGSDRWSNVVLTHAECNKQRGDRLLWKLERPKGWHELKRRHAEREQRHFQHQIVNRLIRLLTRVASQ